MVGRTLGRYTILSEIGAGGMGVVYRAHDSRLDRDVAIKVLPRQAFFDDHQRKRMRKEAIALSRLSHSSIAIIHDFDTIEGIDLLVMELVPGESLSERLARETLTLDEVVRIVAELACGLAAAHERGVIHRDLKPDNIRITPDGRVKILDFGLAKLFSPSDPDESQEKVTDDSMQAGTLPYMSPEQVRGEKLGPASDLFSLGAVFYEMVTGHHPFAAEYAHTVIYNILNATPDPPSKHRPGISEDLDRTILRLLEKDPRKRFQSGSEVAGALGMSPAQTRRGRWIDRSIARGALGVLGVSIALVMVAWLREPSSVYSAAPDERVLRRLTFSGAAWVPVWSPDGSEIAYSQGGKIGVISPEGGPPRYLDSGSRSVITWGWTPDSRAVIVHSLNPAGDTWSVVRVGLHGEERQTLADSANFGDVSHDGRYLAYQSLRPEPDRGVWIQDLTTGEKRALVRPTGKGTATYKPKWSPDDKQLSYVRWNGTGHELWLVSSDGSNDRRIDTGPIQVAGEYCWSKDKQSLIIGGELNEIWSIWQISITGKEHVRLTVSPEEELHVTLAPDEKRFVFQKSVEVSRIAIVDMDSGSLSYPFELDIAAKHPSFSSDGKSLYFQAQVGTRWQLWEAGLEDGRDPTPLVAMTTTSAFQPAVDELANIIHVRADIGRQWRFGRIGWSQTLWRTSPDGGRQEPITSAGERIERIAPTPTRGDWILYSVNSPENYETICILGRTGAPHVLFADEEDKFGAAFDWGPDDTDVLVAHNEAGDSRTSVLSTVDIVTDEMTRLFDLESVVATDPRFAQSDISAIALAPGRNTVALVIVIPQSKGPTRGLYLLDVEDKSLEHVCDFENRTAAGMISWAPDGHRIAVDLYRGRSDIYISEPAAGSALSRK